MAAHLSYCNLERVIENVTISQFCNHFLKAEIAARSVQADQLIASLQAQIEEIKQQAPLPAQIQETILKQENAQLR